jgi:MFS family permease
MLLEKIEETPRSFGLSRAWLTVALLLALNVVALLDRQVISLLVDPIRADLEISDFQVGLLQGLAFAVLYSVCALPLGWAVDRFSRRLIIFAGVLVWGMATVVSAFAHSFGQLLLARSFVGLGEAALAPAAFSILSDLFDRSRLAFVLSVYSTGSVFGAALALAIGAALASLLAGGMMLPVLGTLNLWQSVLFIVGLPGLVLPFLIFLIPEPPRSRASEQVATFGALRRFAERHRAFLVCHMAGFALLISIGFGLLAWVPTVLQRNYQLSIPHAGLWLAALIGTSGVLGNLLNGSAADFLYARGYRDAHLRYYLGGSLIIALFSGLSLLATEARAYLMLLTPVLLLANISGVAAAALQIATPSLLRGKMSAIYLLAVNLFGMIVGPSAVAVIGARLAGANHLNIAMGTFAMAASALAAVCFALGLRPMRRAIAAAEDEHRLISCIREKTSTNKSATGA